MNRRKQSAQNRELFRRFADGQLTDEECATLERRLLAEEDFRRQYIRAMGVEAGLHETLNLMQSLPTDDLADRSSRRFLPQISHVLWTRLKSSYGFPAIPLTLLGSVVLLGAWWLTAQLSRKSPLFQPFAEQRPIAVITQLRNVPNAATSGLKLGGRISPGVLRLPMGEIQLSFMNGAQVTVEGPAELGIKSMYSASLVSGKASARIPASARGFVLNTPDAAIVDMGTEFGVSIDEGGASEVRVTEGEVEVSVLGSDGNTLTSRPVTESKTVRARRGLPPSLEIIENSSTSLPAIRSQAPSPLAPSAAYLAAVSNSRPDIFWRFEKVVDGRIPNEIQSRWNAVIHSDSESAPGISVEKGMVRLSAVPEIRRRIEVDEPIPDLNDGAFSIELWVNPDYFHWATLVSVIPVEQTSSSTKPNLHTNLIELPCGDKLIHEPGSFRFLHRSPPGDYHGLNLFTDGDCTPGFWHHLVCTKTPTELKLFLNGRLLRHLPALEDISGSGDCRLILGALYGTGSDRLLSGALDEVAIYRHALDDNEVAEHYRAMFPKRTQPRTSKH